MNIVNVIEYQYGPGIDFGQEVIIRDDGDGQYIAEWNLPDPKPTLSDLEDIAQTQDFKDWNKARKANLIDRDTYGNINERIHPHTPLGEQLAALRETIAYLCDQVGVTPPQRFQDFHNIAQDEVQKGQDKKAEL